MALGPEVIPPSAPTPGSTPQNDLHAKWMSYLTAPATRAAFAQFGVAMLQPRTQGQTFMGQVGQAFGEAGQAAGRVQQTQLDIGKQARQEARDQARLDLDKQGLGLEQDRNKIAAQNAATQAKSVDAQIAQNADSAALEREKLEIDKFKAKSLDLYYRGLLKSTSIKTAPVGYKEALDALKESSLLQDDPMAYFLDGMAKVNQQFGLGAAPAAGGGGGGAPAPAPTPSPQVDTSKIPAEPIQILKASPTPENKAFFDQTFGPGTADSILGAQ
jgi:hypothetical protein